DDDAIDALLVAGVLTCGLAGWRWGSPVFAGLSGRALRLSRATAVRASALAPGRRGLDRGRRSVAGRRAARAVPPDRGRRPHRDRDRRRVRGRQRVLTRR